MTRTDFSYDSNVLLYLASSEPHKAGIVETLLRAGGIVSVQVLNELIAVARRKFRMSWIEIRELLAPVYLACRVTPIRLETHQRGMQIAERFGYHIYDSVILAAAVEAGCSTLFSEDMQDGQIISGLTIRNPFDGI